MPTLRHALLVAVPALARRFVIAPTGNKAHYRVREQLAGFDLPNDAVGATASPTSASCRTR